MEYLEGGEVIWEREGKPTLRVDESRKICRDVILGLEYRASRPPIYYLLADITSQCITKGSSIVISSPQISYGRPTTSP